MLISTQESRFYATMELGRDVYHWLSGSGVDHLQRSPGLLPGIPALQSHPYRLAVSLHPALHSRLREARFLHPVSQSLAFRQQPEVTSQLASGAGCTRRCGRLLVPGTIPFFQRLQTLFENLKMIEHLTREGYKGTLQSILSQLQEIPGPSKQPKDTFRV